MIKIYGIRNCDTMKKAIAWLEARGVDYQFHDYKKTALEPEVLGAWIEALGWESLLNTRGTTWRGLVESDRQGVDGAKAKALMLAHPSLIKRPVLDAHGCLTVGFDGARYATLLELAP